MYRMNDAKRTLRKIRKAQARIAKNLDIIQDLASDLENAELEIKVELENIKANYTPKGYNKSTEAFIEW